MARSPAVRARLQNTAVVLVSLGVALGDAVTRLGRAGLIVEFYVGKSLWPAGLMPVYPRAPFEASPSSLLPV